MRIKKYAINTLPVFVQNLFISAYNTFLYKKRHGGAYSYYRNYYKNIETLSYYDVQLEQKKRLNKFIEHATNNSEWYRRHKGKSLKEFPVLEKRELVECLGSIATIKEKNSIISLTGGTTGASLKVLYKPSDMQERFAILDHFRSGYGYSLGRKTAWFSGKEMISKKDIKYGKIYRDDYLNRIRFFSTFHINRNNFDYYWNAFANFSPEYIVGFPSSVYDLCSIALQNNKKLHGTVKAFFPTAETLLPHHREVIGEALGCPLIDQYASSEGAPFILQCKYGALHIHPLTGIFEVVDEHLEPAEEGELLVTSFTTSGTPLIRYRIGDRIKLAPKGSICPCNSVFPLVEYIDGRTSDFIWSSENGRINLGNISNCTKDIVGITCFQITQDTENEIMIKVVGSSLFDIKQENFFKSALRERLGDKIKINLSRVSEIPKEKSGKFRIVKNSLERTKLKSF